MSVEKVKLPREVAEAIDYFATDEAFDYPEQAILKVAMEDVRYIGDPKYCDVIKQHAKSIDGLRGIMRALVNGYEVERTPEDKLRNYYEKCSEKVSELLDCGSIDFAEVERWKGEREGIRNTLAILGFKIEGVTV